VLANFWIMYNVRCTPHIVVTSKGESVCSAVAVECFVFDLCVLYMYMNGRYCKLE